MQHPEGAGLEDLKDPWEMNAELPKCQNQAQWIWVSMALEEQQEVDSWGVWKAKAANPADRRVLQAFPNMPAFAKETADSISLCGTSAGVELLWFVRMAFPSARFHRVPNSFLVHNLHDINRCVLEVSSSAF